jgi:hypothetical protein
MRRTPFNGLSFVSSFRRSSVTAAYSFTVISSTKISPIRIVADFSLRPYIEISWSFGQELAWKMYENKDFEGQLVKLFESVEGFE